MITEQELKKSVIACEQYIRDLEHQKQRDKRDTASLHDLTSAIQETRIKLQVLHYTEGLTGMISEEELKHGIQKLTKRIEELEIPQEIDLFNGDKGKKIQTELSVLKTRLFTLQFVAGREKTLL